MSSGAKNLDVCVILIKKGVGKRARYRRL